MNNFRCQLPPVVNFAATAVISLLLAGRSAADPVDSFDDIEFWVGTGSKSAAVAIDWDKNSTATPARVWGCR